MPQSSSSRRAINLEPLPRVHVGMSVPRVSFPVTGVADGHTSASSSYHLHDDDSSSSSSSSSSDSDSDTAPILSSRARVPKTMYRHLVHMGVAY